MGTGDNVRALPRLSDDDIVARPLHAPPERHGVGRTASTRVAPFEEAIPAMEAGYGSPVAHVSRRNPGENRGRAAGTPRASRCARRASRVARRAIPATPGGDAE